MTEAELLTAVSTAIAKTLDSAYWTGKSASQSAAVNMAALDVFSRLRGVTLSGLTDTTGPVISAIAEQALFLLRTHDEQAEGKVVTGEGVEGLSVSYTLLNATDGTLAPRAVAYVEQALRQMRMDAAGSFRFGRG